jgi:GDPmannose 4,6-dehydratase
MKKAIIFGASGQDGFYLKEHLLLSGYQVFSFSRTSIPSVDIGRADEVRQLLNEIKPELIFHLAAKSSVSHDHILENQNSIVNGTLSLLDAVDKHLPEARVFLASSGLVFENHGAPISVENKLVVNSAYTLSRIQALEISRYYRGRGRLIYTGFLFNHESPRRPAASIARAIARNVVQIFKKKKEFLQIGNADVIKEWLWAGDAVRAMPILLMQENIFEICIADGVGHSIRAYAKKCCEYLGLELNQYLRSTENFSAQYPVLVGDSAPLRALGWGPEVDIDGLVKIMIDSEMTAGSAIQNNGI